MHLRDTEHQLSTDEVRDLFSGFGEIKSLRINRKSSSK